MRSKLRENGLVIAMLGLLVASAVGQVWMGLHVALSFALHALGGRLEYNEQQSQHGGAPAATLDEYVSTSRFWFESFQNWQSEFLSVGVLIVLSIYLRERVSPQSKPVHAPHSQTGE